MKLLRARVQNFKSIDDSGWVTMDNVTCLVGKNESGKTTFLQAVQRLSPPAGIQGDFDLDLEYPRRRLAEYKKKRRDAGQEKSRGAEAVAGEFKLDASEVAKIEAALGKGVLKSDTVTITKYYNDKRSFYSLEVDESKVVAAIIAKNQLPSEIKSKAKEQETVSGLITFLEAEKDAPASVTSLIAELKTKFKEPPFDQAMGLLGELLPIFVYFGDYSTMLGRVSITELKSKRAEKRLSPADNTFLALLELVDANLEDLEASQSYERVKANLEAASNTITDELFEFWSQNKQLRMEFDLATGKSGDATPFNSGMVFHIRVRNDRHRVTVPFDNRSRGFVWFFSFLAYFSRYRQDGRKVVLLLDEPGLNLHAKAQGDFLRFIDERLATKHQVVYSTHSPFMVNPSRLDRVRTVEDRDDVGTVISADVHRNSRDTLFPLQAALSYDLSQTLFVGPNCLLVEGPSDLIYLQLLSEAVKVTGHAGLDPRWVVTPVGGADKVATFLSLLGANQLNVAVLLDVATKDKQRLSNLMSHGHLKPEHLVPVNAVTGTKEADIEDVFQPGFYLKVVNAVYGKQLGKQLVLDNLSAGSPRIVKRLEEHFAKAGVGSFNHYLPAAHLLREQAQLMKDVDEATLTRAIALFDKVNSLLGAVPAPALAA